MLKLLVIIPKQKTQTMDGFWKYLKLLFGRIVSCHGRHCLSIVRALKKVTFLLCETQKSFVEASTSTKLLSHTQQIFCWLFFWLSRCSSFHSFQRLPFHFEKNKSFHILIYWVPRWSGWWTPDCAFCFYICTSSTFSLKPQQSFLGFTQERNKSLLFLKRESNFASSPWRKSVLTWKHKQVCLSHRMVVW